MKKTFLAVALTGAVFGVTACSMNSPGQHVTNLPPGKYQSSQSSTDNSNTTTSTDKTTTVGYDADGNKTAVVKTDSTVQPPGITGYFNKSTSSSTQVYQQ